MPDNSGIGKEKTKVILMKKFRVSKIIISFILITAILLGIVPATFAIDEKDETIPSAIVREETDLREESSKTFICEDGSYLAVTYSEPIHFKTESGWQDVNNTLVLSENEKYSPVALGYNVSLPLNIADKNGISIGDGEKTVSFAPISEQKDEISAFASKTDVEKLASNAVYKDTNGADDSYNENPEIAKIERHNETFTSVKNQRSALVYKNVFTGVDYEYIVSSSNLKENIVINRKQEEYKFSFEIDMAGLTPVCNENGSIIFIDSEKAVVFSIPAPYMYDMKKEESSAVEMSLYKSDEKYILTITADSDWINSGERAFPVIIDPTYTFPTDSINNVFVEDLAFANSTRITNELRAGKNLLNLTRTYIKTLLPTTIPYGSVITSAKLTLYKENYYQAPSQSNININACDCSNVSTWNANTVTWNNQPFSNEANGYKSVSGYQITSVAATSDKANYVFELKTVAQKWLNTGTNKGIMLASSNENSKTQVDFYSTRVNTSTQRPKMEIAYNSPGIGQTIWNLNNSSATTSSAISVTCSPTWTITSSQSWLTYTNKTSTSFKAKVTANTGTNTRTGTLQITSGSTIIGTLTVNQSGSAPSLAVNKTNILKGYLAFTDSIQITSNTSWTITKPNWITVAQSSGTGNKSIGINATVNNGYAVRSGDIKIKAGNITRTIKVTQLDEFSCELSEISGNSVTLKSSSQYNADLAKWCMELSYEAYNYLNGTTSGFLDYFMQNHSSSVKSILESQGFANVLPYNYELEDTGAHTIGYRNIVVSNGNILEERQLVVVVVRGSVTWPDVKADIWAQFSLTDNPFMSLARDVCDNLINYCEKLINPIIVFTGHSMGAAIANDAAALINNGYSNTSFNQSNIYCYTFGTPRSVNEYITGDIAVAYNNIFNILNTNDGFTYMPYSWIPFAANWKRNGIDYYINMPYASNWIQGSLPEPTGLLGHVMETYQQWLNSHTELTHSELEALTETAIPMGLVPIVLSVKCPVSVTLIDENDNIVGFESQQENIVYPELTDIGVLSFITDNNEKVFFIPPNNDNITVSISAYDYGSMNYAVSRIGFDDEDETIIYNNVSLYPDKEFEMELSSDDELEDIPLNIVEDGVVVGEVTETNPHFIGITTDLNDVEYPTPVHLTITTDTTVSEINLYNRTRNTTMHLVPNGTYVQSVVNTGDTLVWTVGYYPQWGNNIYDISVKSGDDWYDYDNVIEIRCTHN